MALKEFLANNWVPQRKIEKPVVNIEHHGFSQMQILYLSIANIYIYIYIYRYSVGDGFLSLHLDYFQNTGNLLQSCGPKGGSPFQGPKTEFLCKGVN